MLLKYFFILWYTFVHTNESHLCYSDVYDFIYFKNNNLNYFKWLSQFHTFLTIKCKNFVIFNASAMKYVTHLAINVIFNTKGPFKEKKKIINLVGLFVGRWWIILIKYPWYEQLIFLNDPFAVPVVHRWTGACPWQSRWRSRCSLA